MEKWKIEKVFDGVNSIDNLIITLETMDALAKKYPENDVLPESIFLLRNEICSLFGGNAIK